MHPLAEKVLQGDVRATGRLLRDIDDRVGSWLDALSDLHPYTGKAYVIGITGNPGAGKSTLTDQLVSHYRRAGQRVAVIAVDPTSPYSGGAILGDRIRMQRHALDTGVFIRSIATRGQLGGISRSTADSVRILDAWGAGVILVETVGVGQDELEVARLAHTTVVVMAPGMGDEVQAIKAGILEVADVFCVNKADRDGAHSRGHGAGMLDLARETLRAKENEWLVPIVKSIASRGEGIGQLAEAVEKHKTWQQQSPVGLARQQMRAQGELDVVFRDLLIEAARHDLATEINAATHDVYERRATPYQAAQKLIAIFRGNPAR
jgi:LAO/AO transport system kinase